MRDLICPPCLPAHSGRSPEALGPASKGPFNITRLLTLAPGGLQECLLLMADEFDPFRTVRHDALENSNAKRFRIRLGVVDSEFNIQESVVHASESFG